MVKRKGAGYSTIDHLGRGVGVVYRARLEIECGASHRGFESHPLRCSQALSQVRLTQGGSVTLEADAVQLEVSNAYPCPASHSRSLSDHQGR